MATNIIFIMGLLITCTKARLIGERMSVVVAVAVVVVVDMVVVVEVVVAVVVAGAEVAPVLVAVV